VQVFSEGSFCSTLVLLTSEKGIQFCYYINIWSNLALSVNVAFFVGIKIYPKISIFIPPQTKFEGVYRSELVGRSPGWSVGRILRFRMITHERLDRFK
jgi:hypothetical protein